MDYFDRTGFFVGANGRPGAPLGFTGLVPELPTWDKISGIERDVFGPSCDEVAPAGPLLLSACMALVAAGLVGAGERGGGLPRPARGIVCLAVLTAGLYVVVPEHLGGGHGGFLRPRAALFAALFGLAALPDPHGSRTCSAFRAGAAVLVLCAAGNSLSYVWRMCELVEEATAGVPVAGAGRVVYYVYPHPRQTPGASDPIRHAAGYYCLHGRNVLLSNYEAGTTHFPVVFRVPSVRPTGRVEDFPLFDSIDTVVGWADTAADEWRHPGFRLVFRRSRISIYIRTN
jgi:hypothetical protein